MQLSLAAAAAARFGQLAAAGALAIAISACSMGNMFSSGPSTTSQQFANTSPNPQDIAAINALPAIATECPEIKVKPGSEAIFNYGGGRVGNPRDLRYQAVIDKQTRNCVVANGLITVKMGVVGRLLMGPKGTENSVTIPVRFSVERDNVAVFTERYELPVSVTPPSQSADFVKVVENVAIPYLGGENIVIWVGFDPA